MKTLTILRTSLRGGLFLAMVLASAATCQAAIKAVDYSTDTTARYSAGIADVLKMLDAKVDVGVIQAYIKSSSVIYSPNASEIIALKQRGVPDEILTAMLERGAEVRVQALRAMQAAAPPAQNSYGPPPAQYAPPEQSQAAPVDYGSDYAYPAYYANNNYYPYYYPYYNSYSYWGWPWYASWYWPYYYPYYYHGFHDHFHDGHGGHGHDFNHFGGHNNFAGGHQPWAPAHTWSHAGFASASAHAFTANHTMMASRGFSGGFHSAPMGGGFHAAPAGGGFHGGGSFGGGHAMGGGGGRR